MDAHTLPCDTCGIRYDEDDLEYIEERDEYFCSDCVGDVLAELEDE